MLSAMEYPHWLMVAGAVLVVLGFIGFAFRQKRTVEPDHEPTENEGEEEMTGTDLIGPAVVLDPFGASDGQDQLRHEILNGRMVHHH